MTTETHISKFLKECTVLDGEPDEGLTSMCLYGLYISWCLMRDNVPLPDSDFQASVKEHGLRQITRHGVLFYPDARMIGPASRDYILNSVPAAHLPVFESLGEL